MRSDDMVDFEVATRRAEIEAARYELRDHWSPAPRGQLGAWIRAALARFRRFFIGH